MTKPKSESARWTQIFILPEPIANVDGAATARAKHEQLYAVVEAFQKVGRVVRLETSQFGRGIIVKARKA